MKLLNHQSIFKIGWIKGSSNTQRQQQQQQQQQQFYIAVAGHLDYKQHNFYHLILQVSDGELLTNTTLSITVTNNNNYPPVFDQQDRYNINMSMTSLIGSYVGVVSASDPDFKPNDDFQNVTFSLILSEYSRYFNIESSNNHGVITLEKLLPRTINRDHIVLEALASDNGNVHSQIPRITKTTIEIRLLNKELACRPVFIKNYPKRLTIDGLLETGSTGEFLTKPIARYETEPSCCGASNCFFSLQQQKISEKLFMIDIAGQLSLRTLPTSSTSDSDSSIMIHVNVHNINDPELKDTVTTQIIISNRMNQQQKLIKFERDFNFVYLPQFDTMKVGSLITTLTVSSAVSSTSRFTITSDSKNNNMFRIDNTGRVFLQQRHQSPPSSPCYILKVTGAIEPAVNTSSSSTTLLMVSTLDKNALLANNNRNNDHPSVFARTDYSFVVSEGSPVGWVIGRIDLNLSFSSDADAGTYYYFIDPTATDTDIFDIGQDGYLRVGENQRQNIRLARKYDFKVVIVINCQMYSANIRIRIKDLNNHQPIFVSPTFAYISTTPADDVSRPVYNATALDMDYGQNAQLFYKLITNGNGYFCISEETGHIFLKRAIDTTQHQRVFRLKISVTDHGFPHRKSTQMDLLLIAKKSRSNNNTNTKKNVYYTEINTMASTSPLVPFFKIPQHVTGCKLESHRDVFNVYQNGWVYHNITANMNNNNNTNHQILQQKHFYKLRISTPSHHDDDVIIVYVITRWLSSSPMKIFSSTSFEFNIDENVAVGSIIGEISLVSLQQQYDDTPIVYLPEANYYVEIVNTTQLRLKSPIDCHLIRDARCRIVFHIIGVLNGTEEVTVLHILVKDLDNHAPRFVSDFIAYELDPGQLLLPPVEILDNDLSVNFNLTIAEVHNCSSSRPMVRSGRVVLSSPMEDKTCVLKLRLHDDRVQETHDAADYIISNTAALYEPSYTIPDNQSLVLNISENANLGLVVFKPDNSISESLVFKLSENKHFLIHPVDGIMILSRQLDFETQQIHHLLISVITPTNETSTINITVHVNNENDNAPVLRSSSSSLNLVESTVVGTNIFTCHATDPDGDSLSFSIGDTYDEDYHISDFFTLPTGGEGCSITLQKPLSLLMFSTLMLNISISDGVHTSEICIQLKVERDNDPEIISSPGCLVLDDVSLGDVLYKIEVKESYRDEIKSYMLLEKGLRLIDLFANVYPE